jgi:hypothetical protein
MSGALKNKHTILNKKKKKKNYLLLAKQALKITTLNAPKCS